MNLTLPDDYSYVLREHNIFAWLIERYNTWSSRVGVEFVLAFAAYNQIAFIVMDMIVNVAIMYLIIRLLDIKRLSEKWLVLALLLMYNIHDMSSAGWVATMVNYMWVVAALLIMANILELHFEGRVRKCLLPFSLLIICFAGSHEQGVIALLIMFLTYIGIDYKCNHHINKDIICFFVLSTLLLLFIVLSPGNQIRTQVATTVPGASPLFFESTIFEKVWLGYQDVYAKRRDRGKESWIRKQFSLLFYKILSSTTRFDVLQNVGDFRLLDRQCIEALRRMRESERYTKGMFCWIGFNKKEIVFDRDDRVAGKSNWNFFSLLNLAIEGITSFTTVPLRFASIMGVLISFGAFIYGLYFVSKTLIFGEPIRGFTTLIVVMLFLGGVQLLTIGVLGEYIGRIFNETKHRPVYLVKEYNEPSTVNT